MSEIKDYRQTACGKNGHFWPISVNDSVIQFFSTAASEAAVVERKAEKTDETPVLTSADASSCFRKVPRDDNTLPRTNTRHRGNIFAHPATITISLVLIVSCFMHVYAFVFLFLCVNVEHSKQQSSKNRVLSKPATRFPLVAFFYVVGEDEQK